MLSPAIDVPSILFLFHPISFFNFFYHLSLHRHPLYFCQKQSVDFPADCPALPQSQTWREVWREGENRQRGGENAHKKRGQKRAEGSHDLKSVLKKHHIGPSWCPTVSWQHCRAAFHYMQPFSRLSLFPSFPADCCSELATISPLLTRLFTCTPEENAHRKFWRHAPLSSRQTGETSQVH